MANYNNNSKAEHNLTINYSLDKCKDALKRSLDSFLHINENFNDVLNTYSFGRNKGIWNANYTICFSKVDDDTTNMNISCVGSSDGGETNAQLELYLAAFLNIFTNAIEGKSVDELEQIASEQNADNSLGNSMVLLYLIGIAVSMYILLRVFI